MSSKKIIKIFTTWRFLFFSIWKLPMILIAGIRVKKLNRKEAKVSVPYNYINKNPFNSMYFAVQAMAAELSTGALVISHVGEHNISMLVTSLESKYFKKAKTKINFICLDGDKVEMCIKNAIDTQTGQTCILKSRGYDINDICVSEFIITWSLKTRTR
mgnify:CR=1 FL=1